MLGHRFLILLIAPLLLGTLPSIAQYGAHTAPADLDQLVEQSQTIVLGNVVSTAIEPHPQFRNLRTVVVTMKVEQAFKGSVGSVLVFRQFLINGTDLSSSEYQPSQQLLLFLNPVSAYGLTSPVGLEQGRFRIMRDEKGNLSAVNGRGNLGLFNRVAIKAQQRGIALSREAAAVVSQTQGPVSLSGLESLIQTLVSAQK
ncbi:MAG TPA: hypothetical protein VJT08_16775 [Terriglobales bacterium]|nr:hypothetical protein [Terriglobales bacterium]